MLSTSACAERGSSSHLTLWRRSAPESFIVWIQSIHGRRRVASAGPFAPRTNTGARSHHALKMPISACIRPTLAWSATAIARSLAFA